MSSRIPQVKSFKTLDSFRSHLARLGVELPTVDEPDPHGPLSQALTVTDPAWGERTVGNRFCVLPMEGWDGTTDGFPTKLVERRWEHFGRSGAKLVWGGEAVAVEPDGRANPNQLTIHTDEHGEALGRLRQRLVSAHRSTSDRSDDLLVGLQLTHSGRFSRPDHNGPRPAIVERHPMLDRRLPRLESVVMLSDQDLDELVESYVTAATRAAGAGFDFVDIKACHGYLGHELLGAVDRPGRYGGNLAGRTLFLRSVIGRIRAELPDLGMGVRFSVYDFIPFQAGPDSRGQPEPRPDPSAPYRHGFGGDGTGVGYDLTESIALIDRLTELGVNMICVTAGSPYYVPHIQRPAWFPPSDGYQPPEDPLVGVARLVAAAAELKVRRPKTVVVGSGYSYLQEWLPHVAEAVVGTGMADSVGLGRMMLSYPDLPLDVLAGRPLQRRQLCRTFSDCTTAPRAGLISGCYPLDPFYKDHPQRVELARVKKQIRESSS